MSKLVTTGRLAVQGPEGPVAPWRKARNVRQRCERDEAGGLGESTWEDANSSKVIENKGQPEEHQYLPRCGRVCTWIAEAQGLIVISCLFDRQNRISASADRSLPNGNREEVSGAVIETPSGR